MYPGARATHWASRGTRRSFLSTTPTETGRTSTAAGVSPTGSQRTSDRPLGSPARALIRSVTVRVAPSASGGPRPTPARPACVDPAPPAPPAAPTGPQCRGALAPGAAGLESHFLGGEAGGGGRPHPGRPPGIGRGPGRGLGPPARLAVDQEAVAHDGGLPLAVHG